MIVSPARSSEKPCTNADGSKCRCSASVDVPACSLSPFIGSAWSASGLKLAEAHGCVGLRCARPEGVDGTIAKAMEINDVPVVVDFVVHEDAMVRPMVVAGTSNDDIKIARDMAPRWESDGSGAHTRCRSS
ncbi:Acetolactate synthase large subunit IlvB1 [Streptomyces sp. MP131-18]|nr:Acetolactate synthase large subunit IlvB1 [Streptomyces sp. MP131-18]